MDANLEKKLAQLARKELKRLDSPPHRTYEDDYDGEEDGWFRMAFEDD